MTSFDMATPNKPTEVSSTSSFRCPAKRLHKNQNDMRMGNTKATGGDSTIQLGHLGARTKRQRAPMNEPLPVFAEAAGAALANTANSNPVEITDIAGRLTLINRKGSYQCSGDRKSTRLNS